MPSLSLKSIGVSVEGSTEPLPSWAKSAIEIGAWARSSEASTDGRFLVCCVVPCRTAFSALVGLGAVAAGGTLFRKGFSWADFLNLDVGTEIFWAAPGIRQRLAGILLQHEEIHGALMRPVNITKGPKRMQGVRWLFTETKFRDCVFSEEKLPSHAASERFEGTGLFFKALGVRSDSSWLMTAGAEVRFVSNVAAFRRSLEGWELTSSTSNNPMPLDQLLILRDEGDPSLAKARITHNRGLIASDCPVSILDGPLAFHRIPDIQTGSLVMVLDRNDLAEEHIDLLIQARNEHSQEHCPKLAELAPSCIPATIEITGYCLRAS
jgi:hypothetical protein